LLPAGAFAGWDLHPLESAAFSRRTQIAVIGRRSTERIEPIPSLPFEYWLGVESFGSLNI